MIQEIKKFLLNSIGKNKKGLIFALSFFVILGLVFSPQLALAQASGTGSSTLYLAQPGGASSAPSNELIPGLNCCTTCWGCMIVNSVLSILIKIVVLIFFGIPLILSAAAASVMGLILGWVISPDFISLKFTQNPFVDAGLSITKGFANMGFILFLVVIAVATVLRIEEYKAKKTLATLIIIALLINFSPVFCGIIIDFSNIVMNYFLSAITGINGFTNFIKQSANQLWDLIWTSGLDLAKVIAAATQVIVSTVFNFFCAYIFFLFSALFTLRYIMLWILVIISPVAFVSYILPITRRGKSLLNWGSWLEQLIEWCVIGITGGFFLYLGFFMIDMISANPTIFTKQSNSQGLGLMNNILPYIIPLVLLWIAYREITKTSAMFAKNVIEAPEKMAKTAVTAATAFVGGMAMGAMGAVKGMAAKAVPEGARRWGERQAVAPTWGTGVGGVKGALMRTIGAPVGYARRKVGEAVLTVPSMEKEMAEKAYRDADKRDTSGNLKALREAKNDAQREGILKRIIEKKKLKDVQDENIYGKSALRDNEILPIYKKARVLRDKDAVENIENSFVPKSPEWKDKFSKIVDEETKKYKEEDQTHGGITDKEKSEKGYSNYTQKVMDRIITSDDIKKMQKDWWNNPEAVEAAQKFWSGHQISEAARTFGRSFTDSFQADSVKRGAEWYYKVDDKTGRINNPTIPRFYAGNTARDLGIGSLPDPKNPEHTLTLNTIKRMYDDASEKSRKIKQNIEAINQRIEMERRSGEFYERTEREERTPGKQRDSGRRGQRRNPDGSGSPGSTRR